MTVYVDHAELPFGRMLMNHLVADSTEELNAMADEIGVKRKWIQEAGTSREHFDICNEKRTLALQHGAQPVDGRFIIGMARRSQPGQGAERRRIRLRMARQPTR